MTFKFSDYKKLSPDIKKLATCLWVSEILYQSKNQNIHQLMKYLKAGTHEETTTNFLPKKGYWYKKHKGESIAQQTPFNRIQIIYPEANRLLCHPLWFLLNLEKATHTDLINLIEALPPEISSKVLRLKNGQYEFIELRRSITSLNSLDALVVSLVYHIKDMQGPRKELHRLNNTEIFKLFLRLFSLRYSFKFSNELYHLISRYFPCSPLSEMILLSIESKIIIDNFPIRFGCDLDISSSIIVYKEHMKYCMDSLDIVSIEDQLKFISLIPLIKTKELIHAVTESKNMKTSYLGNDLSRYLKAHHSSKPNEESEATLFDLFH
jgi:hypothetical protein